MTKFFILFLFLLKSPDILRRDSRDGFARVNMSLPALSSVSVCVRLQWDTEWNEVSTIFSYAAPVFTNEFQLRGQVDMRERILLALIIHGKHLPYKASFPNDGAWHHICVTWCRSSSHWAIYVDGDRKDTGSGTDTSRDIHGDGIFILGQDQDSFGGNFTEPFFGTITDLNVWNIPSQVHHFLVFPGNTLWCCRTEFTARLFICESSVHCNLRKHIFLSCSALSSRGHCTDVKLSLAQSVT
uniref:Pentraxin family member n=1 Tax=Seriola dumerili TaxID=41447 RepID=A0A3B4UMX5_SERDU